jgi:antitoxin ParD1/3/4
MVPSDVEFSVRALVANGRYTTAEDVLREAVAKLTREESIAAINAGIADLEAGRYRPWEEVKAEFEARPGSKSS